MRLPRGFTFAISPFAYVDFCSGAPRSNVIIFSALGIFPSIIGKWKIAPFTFCGLDTAVLVV